MRTVLKDYWWRSGGAAAPPYEWFESFASPQQPLDDPFIIETGQSLDIVAQDSNLLIADNYLKKIGSSARPNNRIRSIDSIEKGAGRVIGFKVIPNSADARVGLETTTPNTTSHYFSFNSGVVSTVDRFSAVDIGYSYVNDTIYHCFILLREGGGAIWILLDNGVYYLIGVSTYYDYSEHKLYFDFGSCTSCLIDWARVNTIESLASDWPFDTDALTSPSAGTTFTHNTGGWIAYKIGTKTTSGTMEVRFRVQDANNYFCVKHRDSDFKIQLSVYIAGVETVLQAYGGSINATHEVRIFFNGSNIRVFTNETTALFANVTNANFASETDGEVESLGNGVISYVHTMPFNITSLISEL